MEEAVPCGMCGLRIRPSGSDGDSWVDGDGWFVSEEPALHAHRPGMPKDVVVVFSGSGAATP